MGEFRNYVNQVKWNSDTLTNLHNAWKVARSTSIDSDDALDGAVLVNGLLNTFNATPLNPQPARFSYLDQTLITADFQARAILAHDLYTQALFLDYYYEILPRGRHKYITGTAVGAVYVRAIEQFASNSDSEEYWLAATDSVSRARECLTQCGQSLDALIDATIKYETSIPDYRGIRTTQQLVLALTRNIQHKNASAHKYEEAFRAFWNRANTVRGDVSLLTTSLSPLARLVHFPDFSREVVKLMGDSAFSLAIGGDVVSATMQLHDAAKKARSLAGDLLVPLMKAQCLIQPAVAKLMQQQQSNLAFPKIRMFDHIIKQMQLSSDPQQALMLLGAVHYFIPSKRVIFDNIHNAGQSVAEMIVAFQPMYQHGPASISPEQMRILQLTDIELIKSATLLRSGFYSRSELKSIFEPSVVCKFIIDADVVPISQSKILRAGIAAWREGRYIDSGFILIPVIENAIVRCCGHLGENILTLNRSESTTRRVGEVMVQLVNNALGEDWSFYVKHLWAREEAIRHAFCHGYIVDDQASNVVADLALYTLIALTYKVTTKLAHDNSVRTIAYYCWIKRGRPIGDASKDWFEAERKLN